MVPGRVAYAWPCRFSSHHWIALLPTLWQEMVTSLITELGIHDRLRLSCSQEFHFHSLAVIREPNQEVGV